MVAPIIGSSFTVKVWSGELTYYTGGSVVNYGRSLLHTIYFNEGMAYITLPSGVSPSEPIIDVAWITNT